ncbi:MAG TPA: hypothetical protein VM925_33215 [Labilithrix sp.]|jgi:hypothetical protein|nr:hypothetical protein [Labilithrix sp.]
MPARFALFGFIGVMLGCGRTQSSAAHETAHESRDAPQVVEIVVTSGVPQPAPQDTHVGIGAPLTLRVEGLGPARARVLAPDGSAVVTTDTPLTRDGSHNVVGTEQRFTPQAAGTYRVVHAEAPSVDLARVIAR